MTGKQNRLAAIRFAIAAVLTLQLMLLARGVLTGERPSNAVSLVSAVLTVAAIAILAIAIPMNARSLRLRTVEIAVVVLALALTVRFHLAPYLQRDESADRPRLAAIYSPDLVAFLQNLSSAEEQYRLRYGRYSDTMDALRQWTEQPPRIDVRLIVNGDQGWAGQASLDGRNCSIWVRDSALRTRAWQPEGHATCGTPERRWNHEMVPSVVAPQSPRLTTFKVADISGTWPQHRFDAHRTGVTANGSGTSAHSWNANVGGALRAPVAVAGNQVFVGAHGNGEVVALTLDSGKLGFRVRAPNWVHHEPAVSNDLIVVGFGNNEKIGRGNAIGSSPSGLIAFDRRTGLERWRFTTEGSVMAIPVISDSVVAVSTGGPEVVGVRLRDGAELWRTAVPARTPMGNPMLVDNVMIFGVEKTRACAIDVHTGVLRYCIRLIDECGNCWGAGHASPALAGDVALQVYESDKVNPIDSMIALAKRAIGFPPNGPDPETGEQILVAFGWRDGRIHWRTSLGKGSLFPPGHIAGTPIVVDTVAFIPAANNGNVVAVNARTGRVVWSAAVRSSRGSVTVIRGSVFAATQDTTFVILDTMTGRVRCRERLPARADRAGLTIAGETGILTLGNGTVMARPLSDWLACHSR